MRIFLFFVLLLPVTSFYAQSPSKVGNVTGIVYRYANFPSKNTETRNVDVWLPADYNVDPNKKYAVLYMHDGQNLFNPKNSISGIDWGIDETLTRLIKEGKVRDTIVVGIWSTAHRIVEFMPEKAFDARNKRNSRKLSKTKTNNSLSDKYLRFIISELKPFIDKNYRTLTDRSNTFVMGSSMGALMSLYAITEYPNIFGGAGCLSPQYPLAKGVMLVYMQKSLPSPKNHKIYFDYGTRGLDAQYSPYQARADELMRRKGYLQDKNWVTRKFEGDDHTEKSWRRRVDIPLMFLLAK